MHDVLSQYAELIKLRREKVAEVTGYTEIDMRTGWLLWQETLEEFLYFEEALVPPNPNDYFAKWNKTAPKGSRKGSVSLWIYEQDTGIKRYSVTTSAGAKIQPYFDVPPPNDPNLYYFKVQGEEISGDEVRIWIMPATERELVRVVGSQDKDAVSNAILSLAEIDDALGTEENHILQYKLAVPITITKSAYITLKTKLDGVSDEHRMRLFIESYGEARD